MLDRTNASELRTDETYPAKLDLRGNAAGNRSGLSIRSDNQRSAE